MTDFLPIFKHVLPRAKAWRITIDKTLRRFFDGLAQEPDSIREFFDDRFEDSFPATTTAISEFLEQFNLRPSTSTANDRLNIAGAWRLADYQSPAYIQSTLQAAGFDVYVHEWWEMPIAWNGNPTPRNPISYCGPGAVSLVSCDEPWMQCDEPDAQCDNYFLPDGYALVNKTDTNTTPVVPVNPAYWPYFLYIGGAVFPNLATVDADRQAELESLCLRICPTQQWLGMLINYV